MKKALTTFVAVLLMVIVAQWFTSSRVRRENQMLRDALARVEQERLELQTAFAKASQHDTEAQSLRADLVRLRGEPGRVRQELQEAKTNTSSAPLPPERSAASLPPGAPVPATDVTPSSVVLAPIDIAPDSLRVSAVGNGRGNLRVRLLGKSSEEIGAMAGIRKCDIIIDGQVADGAVRWVDGGTNVGLVLGFKTHAQAEAAAAALRGPKPQ